MRVFVTGTGRCGTVTFSKACSHINNFSSGHETYSTKLFGLNPCLLPDNRIEVDPHFANFLPLMVKFYPSAKWVHLIREKQLCVESITKATGMKYYSRFATMNNKVPISKVAETYYDITNENITKWISDLDHKVIHLENIKEDWCGFWDWIGAKRDFEASVKEFSVKYNNGKQKYGS